MAASEELLHVDPKNGKVYLPSGAEIDLVTHFDTRYYENGVETIFKTT